MSNNGRRNSLKSLFRVSLALAGVIGLFWVARQVDLQEYLRNLLAWIGDLGALGFVIFGLTYIVATVAFLPGLILTLGAGILFGVVKGTALVSISSTLGAGVAFLAGRHLARDWVARKIEGNEREYGVK